MRMLHDMLNVTANVHLSLGLTSLSCYYWTLTIVVCNSVGHTKQEHTGRGTVEINVLFVVKRKG